MQIDADQPCINRPNQSIHIEVRLTKQDRAQIGNCYGVSALRQVPVEHLESDGKVLVEWRDRNIARCSQEWKVDIPAVAEIKEGRRMQQNQVSTERPLLSGGLLDCRTSRFFVQSGHPFERISG